MNEISLPAFCLVLLFLSFCSAWRCSDAILYGGGYLGIVSRKRAGKRSVAFCAAVLLILLALALAVSWEDILWRISSSISVVVGVPTGFVRHVFFNPRWNL